MDRFEEGKRWRRCLLPGIGTRVLRLGGWTVASEDAGECGGAALVASLDEPSVLVCDGIRRDDAFEGVVVEHESLILAQNERWRQA